MYQQEPECDALDWELIHQLELEQQEMEEDSHYKEWLDVLDNKNSDNSTESGK